MDRATGAAEGATVTEGTGGAQERTSRLIQLGRHSEAAEVARQGLLTDPDDPGLTLLLAIALSEAGQAAEALEAAERAVALRPDSAIAQRTLGWTVYKQGRHSEAALQLAKAITLDPHDAEAHIMRAEALLKRAQRTRIQAGRRRRMVDEAEHHASEAVRLEPTAAGGYLVHGKACVARSDAVGARLWAERALAVEPDHPVGHQILGLAAQIRGDTRAAADHYLDAGKLNPRSGASMKMLRSLRTSLPLSGLALFITARLVLAFGQVAGGIALAIALLVVLGMVGYRIFGARWHARRAMSDEARQALVRDRQMRGSWSRRR